MLDYNQLADKFNSLWFFTPAYEKRMVEEIAAHLELSRNDVLADIGGGTGKVALDLAAHTVLDHPPICVEPSVEMAAIASKELGVSCVTATGQGYLAGEGLDPHINRVLIKEAIHHIADRKAFWRLFSRRMPLAKALVVTRPQIPGFPLFDAAINQFTKDQPPIDDLMAEAQQAGLSCRVHQVSIPITMSKAEWLALLKSRFMSSLRPFSDGELTAGIEECREALPDLLHFNDTLLFMVVTHGNSAKR